VLYNLLVLLLGNDISNLSESKYMIDTHHINERKKFFVFLTYMIKIE